MTPFRLQWDISWSDGQDSLPTGSVYVGKIKGVKVHRAPDGSLYGEDPFDHSFHKIHPPYPPEVQEAVAKALEKSRGGDAGGHGSPEDARPTDDGSARPRCDDSGLVEITVPSAPGGCDLGPDASLTVTHCLFTPPVDCGFAHHTEAGEADSPEEPSTISILLDFYVDVDEDTAQIEYTLVLDDPDIENKMVQLIDMFGVDASAAVDSEVGTTTIGVEGTTPGVLRSLYVLGFEKLRAESAWPGNVEIKFNQEWSAIFVLVDDELERFIPMRLGAD